MFYKDLGKFYEVFRKPDANDPNRPFVSIHGMIITALIFVAIILGLTYIVEEYDRGVPNPRYYEAPKNPSMDKS